jgi:hypothetical protein
MISSRALGEAESRVAGIPEKEDQTRTYQLDSLERKS